MPTFVYMTSCDGCGHCVDICPSDIMHIDPVTRRAVNIEPNFSHMFFKPAAAYQKNMAKADGGRRNLPAPSEKPSIYGKVQRHSHHY
jgi:adenylylsulfate reductase subunit B